jgi:hypothetical protein
MKALTFGHYKNQDFKTIPNDYLSWLRSRIDDRTALCRAITKELDYRKKTGFHVPSDTTLCAKNRNRFYDSIGMYGEGLDDELMQIEYDWGLVQ